VAITPPQLNPLLTFPDNSQLPEMSVDGIIIDRVYGATGVLDTIQSKTTSQYQDPNSNQINPPAQISLPNQGNSTVWYSSLVDDVYNTGFALAFQFSRTTYINYVTFDLLNVPCSWTLLQVSGTYSPIIGGNVLAQGIVNGTNSQGWINFEETLPETCYFDSSINLVLVITKLPTGTQYNFGVQNFLTKLVVQEISDIEMNIGSFAYDQYISSLAPSAWWKLSDAVENSPTAIDSSGNGYIGTVMSGVTFGKTGPTGTGADTAALFNGISGHISTSFQPSGTAFSLTVALNMKKPSGSELLVSSSDERYTGIEILIDANGNYHVKVGNGTTMVNFMGATVVADSTWHFITFTYNGSIVRSYVDYNSTVDGSAVLSGSILSNLFSIVLGTYAPAPGTFNFSGTMAQVAIFNTVLTTAQLAALKNAVSVVGQYTIPSMTTQNSFGFIETFTSVIYNYGNFQVPNQESIYWKCSPQPVKDAVVWFTLDLGQTQVINRMYVDPLYTGCSFNLYWSIDNINWTPVNQDLTLHKGMYCLNPICARYLKLEFSQLVPEVYDLPFDAVNRVVQVFPDYVDTYFLGLEQALLDAPAQTYNNLVGNSPNILYNTSPSISSNYGALVGQLTSDQFGGSPTNLGLANLGDNSSSYSVVDPTVSYKNLQDVANEGSIFSNVGDTPFMNRRFYQYGPHTYKEVLINQTWHEAYFVGIKYLSFYNIEQIGFPQ
jgi:hypothetical protein